jgi:hypothetical protein
MASGLMGCVVMHLKRKTCHLWRGGDIAGLEGPQRILLAIVGRIILFHKKSQLLQNPKIENTKEKKHKNLK